MSKHVAYFCVRLYFADSSYTSGVVLSRAHHVGFSSQCVLLSAVFVIHVLNHGLNSIDMLQGNLQLLVLPPQPLAPLLAPPPLLTALVPLLPRALSRLQPGALSRLQPRAGLALQVGKTSSPSSCMSVDPLCKSYSSSMHTCTASVLTHVQRHCCTVRRANVMPTFMLLCAMLPLACLLLHCTEIIIVAGWAKNAGSVVCCQSVTCVVSQSHADLYVPGQPAASGNTPTAIGPAANAPTAIAPTAYALTANAATATAATASAIAATATARTGDINEKAARKRSRSALSATQKGE